MGSNTFYILRFRKMHFVGKGDPDHFEYHEVGRAAVKSYLEDIINKYHLKMVDKADEYGDGYELIEEKTVTDVDLEYILSHKDSDHICNVAVMFPEEVENKLEHWDLFRKDNSLYAGKSWPYSLQGCIATFFNYNISYWCVREIENFAVSCYKGKPVIEWYNNWTNIDADKFVEYMDNFREVITHTKLAEHEMQLGNALKRVNNGN